MMFGKSNQDDDFSGMLDLMVALDKCSEDDKLSPGNFYTSGFTAHTFPSLSSSSSYCSISPPPPLFQSPVSVPSARDWSLMSNISKSSSANSSNTFFVSSRNSLDDLFSPAPIDYGPIGASRTSNRLPPPPPFLASGTPSKTSTRYKTELCRPFAEAGSCKYGDKCQFAHGMAEMRKIDRHPKYKTDLCKTYYSTGICPYGSRCHFVHNVVAGEDFSNASFYDPSASAESNGLSVRRSLSHGESGYTSEEGSCGSRFSPTEFDVDDAASLFSGPGGRISAFTHDRSPTSSKVSSGLAVFKRVVSSK